MPASVNRIVLIVGYLKDKIQATIGNKAFGRPVLYVTQSALNGTWGALQQAKGVIKSDDFLVLNGDDIYCRKDLTRLMGIERGFLVKTGLLDKSMASCVFAGASWF